jgi:hypothetical protein
MHISRYYLLKRPLHFGVPFQHLRLCVLGFNIISYQMIQVLNLMIL